MNTKPIFRGLLSIFLTGVLFLLLPARTGAAEADQWNLYFGLLHAHTGISDGTGTVEEAFAKAAAVEGLDFFAVTDHSNSFDNAQLGAIGLDGTGISRDWAAGKAAAAAVTGEDFVGMFGFEMTWRDSDNLGHINTFGTPGWISRNQEGYESVADYCQALSAVSGAVSQFNHPGTDYGDFQNFSNRTDVCDDAISLLEVGGENGFTAYGAYDRALAKGWHVAPTISQNNHDGRFGTASEGRTVILARELTESSLYEAMAQRRVYATEDRDLRILFRLNGQIMGSVTGLTDTVTITAELEDPTDGIIGTVQVQAGTSIAAEKRLEDSAGSVCFTLPGEPGYYYLRILQPDGDVAVTAPVWVEVDTNTPPDDPEPETSAPAESTPEESMPEESIPAESTPDTPPDSGCCLPPGLGLSPFFGILHSHSDISGYGPPVEEAFLAAAETDHMDYFAVTDASQAFDNADLGHITTDGATLSRDWARGQAAAEAVTDDSFVGFYGYEMMWPDDRNLGHISTFASSGFISRNREGFSNLTDYYEALTTAAGAVSQFNHPGPDVGEFEAFRSHRAEYDDAISLLEIGDGRSFAYYDAYIRALDQGWHVAPTAGAWDPGQSPCRTVLLAEDLTEENLLAAMKSRQVYTSADADFALYFSLDDAPMGAVVPAASEHQLQILTADPTDPEMGIVEVITEEGRVAAREAISMDETLALTIPGGNGYYFLKFTQADGDVAITAPVWTDSYEDAGIASFSTDAQLPLQGEEISLHLSLFNQETVDFQVESLELYVNDTPVPTETVSLQIPAAGTTEITIPYTHPLPGVTLFRAEITGTLGGIRRTFQKTLAVSFRAREMVAGILVDSGYSGLDAGSFRNLLSTAAQSHMEVSFFSGNLPAEGSILFLPPPQRNYSPEFLLQVKIFCARGGSLVVCGTGSASDPAVNPRLNRLLETVGSSLRLQEDTVTDPVHNGGEEDALYPDVINRDTVWCADAPEGAFYVHCGGSSVDPGKGTWLVRGKSTAVSSLTGETGPVLLAWEELPHGAHIFAAGSLFPADNAMPLPKNIWENPRVNLTVTEALLGIKQKQIPLSTIREVREGSRMTLYRIRGHTTSGTSNPCTTFPDTLYVQDETGGIAVVPFRDGGIQVGRSIEIVGYVDQQKGNTVLVPVDYRLTDDSMYRYVPDTQNHSRAMDYAARGGQLLQVEARVTSVTLTEDGLGVSRFTLEDAWGDKATVLIETCIRSGAYGTNTLTDQVRVGRTVRALGLLHLDENGIPVLRVRNCDEVVWVPPVPHPASAEARKKRALNPYTGDPIPAVAAAGLGSAALAAWSLYLVKKRST